MIRVTREEGHYTLKRVKKLPPRGNSNLLYAFIAPRIDRLFRWLPNGEYEEILLGEGTAIFEATSLTFDSNTRDLTAIFADGSTHTVPLGDLFAPTNLSFDPITGDIDVTFADGTNGTTNLYQNATSLNFDPVTGDLTATFLNGISSTVNIDIPNSTSDLTNDGENGTDPFITSGDVPEYTLSPISGTNIVDLLRNGVSVSSIDLTPYLDDTNLARLVSGSIDSNGIATFTRDDNSTFTVDFSGVLITDARNGTQIFQGSFELGGPLERNTTISMGDPNTTSFSLSFDSISESFEIGPDFIRWNNIFNNSTFFEISNQGIRLIPSSGSPSVPGYVWTASDTTGLGEWQPAMANPQGLEQLDQGNGIGWRLVQPTPIPPGSTFTPVGFNATDLTRSQTNVFTNIGAGGSFSLSAGDRNQAFGLASTSSGERNQALSDHSVAIGIGNIVTGDRSTSFGSFNTVSGGSAFSAGAQNTSSGLGSSSLGTNNISSGTRSFTSGIFNTAPSANEFVIGSYSTEYTPTGTNADRAFNVGIGSSTLRSDAFSVFKNGVVTAPDLEISEIDAEPTGRVLLTREWFNANAVGGGGTTTLTRTGAPGTILNNFDITLGGTGTDSITLVQATGLEVSNSFSSGGKSYNLIGDPQVTIPIGTIKLDTTNNNVTNSNIDSQNSLLFGGGNNIGTGADVVVLGQRNSSTNPNGVSILGSDNTHSGVANSQDDVVIIGDSNDVINASRGFSIGDFNLNTGLGSKTFGTALLARSNYEVVVGVSNTDYTPFITDVANIVNGQLSPDRLFVVGNGDYNGGSLPPSSNSRSDALIILKNGLITAPSLEISQIDAEPTGRVLITKEWFNANNTAGGNTTISRTGAVLTANNNFNVALGGSGTGNVTLVEPSGLERITEGSNTGFRLIGADPNNYGNIGSNAVDFSVQPSPSTTTGATQINSFAEGSGTTASGGSSHAEGSGTTASSFATHAEGSGTTASGQASHAEGANTIASGQRSHAEGSGTTASGGSSHAEGEGTMASAINSHAEGSATTASGDNSHAEGSGSVAVGPSSHAEGFNTTASAFAAHAQGQGTTASGNNSRSGGLNTTASGPSSVAEGQGSVSTGTGSYAGGVSSEASGTGSYSMGDNNFSRSRGEVSVGINGTDYTPIGPNSFDPSDRVFNVGNGPTFTSPSDAFTIFKDGSVQLHPINLIDVTNPQAGIMFIDSSDGNRLKFHDGTAFRTVQFV